MMQAQNIFAQRAGMGMPGGGGAPMSTLARPVMPGQMQPIQQPQQPQPMQNNLARPVMQAQQPMQGQMPMPQQTMQPQMPQPQMPIQPPPMQQAPQNFMRQRLGMMQ